jgi:broad specificity phosphatase PhoE
VTTPLPVVYLARHGETEWSRSGRHTGRTDVPLTPMGEAAARTLADRLRGVAFARVFTSPLIRARRTCDLAGFTGDIDPDLMEWDYGRYEGRTTADIKVEAPEWDLFTQGVPGGETPADIAARADRVVAKVRAETGPVLLFSSGHFLRVLAARWCGLGVTFARHLLLDTASVSVLGYAHNRPDEPAVKTWNRTD